MPTIDEPSGICGAHARASVEQRPRVRRQRPVPVLVLGLERRPDHARRRVVDEHVERPELGDLRRARAPRRRCRAAAAARRRRPQLLSRLLGRAVVPQVPDRHPRGAVLGEPQRDRLADPARTARHEDGRPFEGAHRRGSGSSAGAELGISSQPGDVAPYPRALLRLGRSVAEPVEQLHLLLRVAAHLVILGQVEHQLLDTGAQLVGEVRRRRTDERVDLVDGRLTLRHGRKPNG